MKPNTGIYLKMTNTVRLKLIGNFDSLRTKNIIKNIYLLFITKAGGTLINLMLIPLTINYVSPVQYGIWLTISSMTSWLNLFDIGIGNGLRNKLSYNLALNNFKEAKVYISSTYAVLGIVSMIILAVFSTINPMINWNDTLNISELSSNNLQSLMFLLALSFSIQFVTQLINTVLLACHRSSMTGIITLLGQLLTYISIIILKENRPGTLLNLLVTMSASPIIIMIITSCYLYKTSLRHIAPSIKNIKWSYSKEIINTGNSFFIIQIGALVLFQTSNIIIAKIQGPTAVTEYNIVYRLFSLYIMFFTIIITPFWSAFNDAYAKSDTHCMKSSVKKIRKFWLFYSLITIPILIIFSNSIYKLWIGSEINISITLTISVAIYSVCYTGMSISCYFLNGIGRVKLQKWMYIVVCFINIPLSFYLGVKIGTPGIVISNLIGIFIIMITLWIQTNKVLSKEDSGIWST